MLATMTSSPHQHGHASQYNSHHHVAPATTADAYDYADPDANMEDRICPGCKKSAVSENGGLVVAFGQSFFHVDCFKCAKCGDQVTADTNLLLLSDGSPICANCSYSCNVCHLPILDEAIMTGDDSYHAHCFKCKVCKTRIDELVFAKTSQGIYCMNCHNERMAKIRRHAQKKKERERAGDSSKSRERSAKEFGQLSPRPEGSFSADNSMRSQASATPSRNDRSMGDRSVSDRSMDRSRQNSQSPLVSERDRISPGSPRNAPKQPNQPLVSDAFEPQTLIPPTPTAISITPETPPRGQRPAKPLSVSVAAQKNGDYSISSDTPSPSRARFQEQSVTPTNSTGDHPGSSTPSEFLQPNKQGGSSSLQRKKSYDDGMRPLNVLYQQKSRQNSGDQSEGLSVPSNGSTSRSDKRRSFIHEVNAGSSTHKLSPTSPRSPTFSQSLHPDSRSDSPLTPSPTREQFPTTSSPRSMSPQINSARNSASTTFHSMGTSSDQGTDITNARTRSASSSTYLPERSPSGDARPPLRPSVTMDQVPRDRARLSADGSAFSYGRGSPTLGPPNGHAVRLQKSFDDGQRAGSPLGDQRSSPNSNSGGGRPTSGSRSRPTSDSRRADVPHSIESGTDTEAEKEEPRQSTDSNGPPPAPPPKEPGTRPSYLDLRGAREQDASMAAETTMQVESANTSEDPEESSPVESTSVATFIAPALPPIRFSMTGADFSDMLKNVGGMPSLKALDHLAKLTEESSSDSTPPTPPSSSALPVTPSTDRTAVNGKMTAAPQNKIRRKPLPGSSEGRTSADESRPSPAAFERVASESTPRRPHTADSTTRSRSSSDGQAALTGRPSIGSNSNHGHITITAPDSNIARPIATDTSDLVVRRLQEAFADANERGAQQLKLDKGFVEAILTAFDHRKEAFLHLKVKYDGMRRASQHYEEGLTVAQTEYDRELKARRDADAEVTRLRVLLSGQAARLTMISGEVKKQEVRQQLSQERTENVDELERDLSKLQVERDMALAEVEELSATKQSPTYADGEVPAAKLGRSLTMRLDNIKKQYEHELIPLTQQREALNREIADLKAARDMFLEETTVLNARNEELAQLSAQYARRMDASNNNDQQPPSRSEAQAAIMEKKSGSFDRTRTHPAPPNMQHSISSSSNVSSTVVADDSNSTYGKPSKGLPDISSPPTLRAGKFKWPGSKPRDLISSAAISDHKPPGRLEHTFQQLSVLRFTRCDHCGDKMWGSQLRCSGCNLSVHVRCINHVQVGCSNHPSSGRSEPQAHIAPLPPSMFGRDLAEQVRTDARGGDRQVPIIVEKCVDAIEALALDYEGIYRKNGGSGQSKAITQLFERGDYNAFDLRDQDQFNDICSVTSVLKTYFRSLPIPLLTYDLHDEFMSAASMKDPDAKYEALLDAVNKLPNEHYYTLRLLMLHLHNIREHSDVNLMTARNLGVVFGPTLMRSRDPAAEFSDMAGKAISIEWLVDNAPIVFAPPPH